VEGVGWKGVSRKDVYGITPLTLLDQRSPSEELRETFERSLDLVERCVNPAGEVLSGKRCDERCVEKESSEEDLELEGD